MDEMETLDKKSLVLKSAPNCQEGNTHRTNNSFSNKGKGEIQVHTENYMICG